MGLMDLIKITADDCPIIIVDGVKASLYRHHADIPLKYLWERVKMVRGFDNQLMVWVE